MNEVKERALVPSGGMNGRIPLRQQAWSAIPEYTLEALIDYVEHGQAGRLVPVRSAHQ